MKTFATINDFCNNVARGTFGISVIAVTEPKMNKRNNPYYGRVHKATYMTNIALGYDYQNVVNNRLERNGFESNFVAEKPKGKSWFNYPFILESDKDSSTKYLRCTMRNNTKSKVVYILDGKIVENDMILQEIKNFIPTSSSSQKQQEHGLNEEEQVIVRDYKLDSIIAITQGEKVYNKLNGLIQTQLLVNCFK